MRNLCNASNDCFQLSDYLDKDGNEICTDCMNAKISKNELITLKDFTIKDETKTEKILRKVVDEDIHYQEHDLYKGDIVCIFCRRSKSQWHTEDCEVLQAMKLLGVETE